MFGNLGVHIIKNPAGTFSFVGTLPAALATLVPATTADIMAGRAFTAPNGAVVAPKFPVFATAADAAAFAAGLGIAVKGASA